MKDGRFQILLTNDDGIQSPALWAAADALAPLGFVTVAAPREQSSGAGRSLPKTSDGRIERRMLNIHGQEWETYAVGGTPAQAVLHALRSRYPEKPQQVWTWCASYPDPELPAETNWDDPADWLLDIRSWVDRKWQALRAHRSQVEAIARFLSARNSPIMSEKVESFHFLPDLSAGFPSDQ